MIVRYAQRRGQLGFRYLCHRRTVAKAEPPCQVVHGPAVDEAVAQVVLDALTPTALDVALEVFEELRARKAEIDRLRRTQVERAREDAELAQRQFMLVRPEHRLVADSLERQWNDKLARLVAAEDAYRRATTGDEADLSAEARARIHALASDLPRVWRDPRTPVRERKRMLRLLIEDVTLRRDRTIQLQIRWKGGATSTLECPVPLASPDLRRTPPAIVEMIRALATEQTDPHIAATLNGRSLRSGTGQPFTPSRVRQLRHGYGIPTLAEHPDRAGWLTVSDIAAQLSVHPATARRFAAAGVLRSVRANDRGLMSSSHQPGRCRGPIRASAFAIAAVIPSLRRTRSRRCSMKLDPPCTSVPTSSSPRLPTRPQARSRHQRPPRPRAPFPACWRSPRSAEFATG
jgi:hypothetical protein